MEAKELILTATNIRSIFEDADHDTQILVRDTDGEILKIGRVSLENIRTILPADIQPEGSKSTETHTKQIIIQLIK